MISPFQVSSYHNDLINVNNIHLNIVNSCGYCSSKKTWLTSGFSCPQMTPETYQILLEKGWRRCGTYYYKPELKKCCCRPYTLRLEAQKYKFRSSHLHSLKKFIEFLKKKEGGGNINKEPPEMDWEVRVLLGEIWEEIREKFKINGKTLEIMRPEDKDKIRILSPNLKYKRFQKATNLMWLLYVLNESQMKSENIEFKVFRLILSEFVQNYLSTKPLCKFQVQFHPSGYISIALKETLRKKINVRQYIEDLLQDPDNTDFEIKTVPAKYEDESFEVYRKYSKFIHGITESKESYCNFLCQQALSRATVTEGGQENIEENLELKYGCFHMKYYLRNRLIAVGVVDILPKGLSSVYFFYDPEYKKNSMGVIGSLREIALVISNGNLNPKFQYYYMGYYIQSSQKMKYKGDFEPSELLCPRTLKWITLNEKTRLLINQKREDPALSDEPVPESQNLDQIKVTKEYLLSKKRLFFMNDWILLGELQSRYVNLFLDKVLGIGQAMGKEMLERFEFTMK